MVRLTDRQRDAVRCGCPERWQSCASTGITGSTMDALAARGLAHVLRPRSGGMLYRLTSAGNELRVGWAIEEAAQPVASGGVRVRCTHCGAEYSDGTPGGSCACGMPVEAV